MPLLEGLDGVQKMSKSFGNYVGINEPPAEMFGKLMSISDDLMERYYLLLLGKDIPPGSHPMDAKKQLAFEIVARYHSASAAQIALEDFNTRFSRKNLEEADLPTVAIPSTGTDILTAAESAYRALGQSRTRSEIRRLVEQGSVQLRGEKITDPKGTPSYRVGDVLRLDKKRAVRLN
jgi:tyrosyl-tRNA synthetase